MQTAKQESGPNIGWIFVPLLVIIVVFTLLNIFVIIGPGERGILLRWGAITGDALEEGLHFKLPISDYVDVMDIKTLKYETGSSAASKDLQIVTSQIALNYRLKSENVLYVRENIGMDYRQKIIEPAIQEAIKASTAKFTAEELITKRPIVRDEMQAELQEKLNELSSGSIVVEKFNIIDFDFSSEFNNAIEAKVTAEQLAFKAERDLERIKIEAEQKIAQAKAEAESLRIQAASIKDSKDILELRWIEKWNGILPQTLVGSEDSNLLLGLNMEAGK